MHPIQPRRRGTHQTPESPVCEDEVLVYQDFHGMGSIKLPASKSLRFCSVVPLGDFDCFPRTMPLSHITDGPDGPTSFLKLGLPPGLLTIRAAESDRQRGDSNNKNRIKFPTIRT